MKNLNEMMSLAEEMDKITPKPLKKNNNNKIMPGRYVVERYYEKSAIGLDEQEKIKNLLVQHQWIGGGQSILQEWHSDFYCGCGNISKWRAGHILWVYIRYKWNKMQ